MGLWSEAKHLLAAASVARSRRPVSPAFINYSSWMAYMRQPDVLNMLVLLAVQKQQHRHPSISAGPPLVSTGFLTWELLTVGMCKMPVLGPKSHLVISGCWGLGLGQGSLSQ